MKVVILAAGMGKRFGKPIPKTLVKVLNEKTILDFQIERLSKRIDINNILVVIGYKKELIIQRFPNLNFIFNDLYENTNTSKSLLLALQKIDDDVLCLNSDIYFDEKVLDLMTKQRRSCCLVDTEKTGLKQTKYNLDEDGFIKKMSKALNKYCGEVLGIRLIKKKDLNVIKKELEKVDSNVYVDQALTNLIDRNKLKLLPVYIGNLFCKEFDSESDLLSLRKQISS